MGDPPTQLPSPCTWFRSGRGGKSKRVDDFEGISPSPNRIATVSEPHEFSDELRPHTDSPWMLLRPLALCLPLAIIGHSWMAPRVETRSPDTTGALARALEERALETEPLDIVWLDPVPGWLDSLLTSRRAIVRAHATDALSDIYLARTRFTPEGQLWRIVDLAPLSETSAVDEQQLVASDGRAAWTVGGGGETQLICLTDLAGEALPAANRWGRLAQMQIALTNLQEYGSAKGVSRRLFKLSPPASEVVLGFSDQALLIQADGKLFEVPTRAGSALTANGPLVEQRLERGRPGNLLTWAVDRVRALPWFGSDRMQALKAIAFGGLDILERFRGTVTGDDGADTVVEELGALATLKPTQYTDPDTGWPPAPMRPQLSPPLEGEGQWRSLGDDPFIPRTANAPAAFAFSFIRVDPERKWSQAFITLWDPRQVELHTMSGTREPKSATGETGPGLVPRKPKEMRRFAAALNGGFQATHGEFGMMADGVVYLPPKPFAATVARLSDGSTGFGTWPRDESIPENIRSFRQNMTPLVLDGQTNPYQRTWWGGVPPGWDDETRTVRTAICMTKEGFVAYIYGSRLEADHLAKVMQLANCSYGIHLDMNPGHTGLEFYHVAPKSELPDLGRRLDARWEARGRVPNMPGWEFLGRRMIRHMGLMNFPRYIQRESRDFFYLNLRPILPGEHPRALIGSTSAKGDDGLWKTSGLPQHGWPFALATSTLELGHGASVRILKLDARALAPESDANNRREKIVVLRRPSEHDDGVGLWWTPTGWIVADQGTADSVLIAKGAREPANQASAVGIDEDDMLIFVEPSVDAQATITAAALDQLLAQLGCEHRLLLDASLQPLIAGEHDLAGRRVARRRNGLVFVRGQFPGAKRIFSDTPIVAPAEWQPLQAKRVRYFKEPPVPQDLAPGAAAEEQLPGAPHSPAHDSAMPGE